MNHIYTPAILWTFRCVSFRRKRGSCFKTKHGSTLRNRIRNRLRLRQEVKHCWKSNDLIALWSRLKMCFTISTKGKQKNSKSVLKFYGDLWWNSHFESKFMPVLGLASNDNFVDVVAMVVWDLSENPWTNDRPIPSTGMGSEGLSHGPPTATFKYLEYDMNHVVLVDS